DSSHFSKLVSVEHFTHWVKAMMIKSSYCSNSYSYTQRRALHSLGENHDNKIIVLLKQLLVYSAFN
ncbi:hypothetical protein L2734_16145, partial [Parashewanella spongiae]|uniref:hypothetical protein n=1 Tax=Parashewanella spongiae TaxID=342950 RepID=UPI00200BC588